MHYDLTVGKKKFCPHTIANHLGIDLSECVDPPQAIDSARKLFERKIRYWQNRPMSERPDDIVSPADARMVTGSFLKSSALFIKNKFFEYEELLGIDQHGWLDAFVDGDFAIFRLTPEKYHYNHCPVSGKVIDFYEIDGCCHSCNPGAVSLSVSPYSKNHRMVTIIDTDVPDGSKIGLVAMIEIVALMIGDINQCYSTSRYDNPQSVCPDLFLTKGQPKSLYRPGSSVDVLIFQKNRVRFCPDIIFNQYRQDVSSRFCAHFGRPLVETDVKVRSTVAFAIKCDL